MTCRNPMRLPIAREASFWGLVIAILTGLLGCSADELEFLVVDEGQKPVEGVLVAYYRNTPDHKELVEIGSTDSTGILVVSGSDLAPDRTYEFDKRCILGSYRGFIETECAFVTIHQTGRYVFNAWESTVTRLDLRGSRTSGGRPRKRVRLRCAEDPEVTQEDSTAWEPQWRFLRLESEAHADVKVGGDPVGTTSDNGRLDVRFCPRGPIGCCDDSVSITITTSEYYAKWDTALWSPGDTVALMRKRPEPNDIPDDTPPEAPVPRPPPPTVRVRIENRSDVRSCGSVSPYTPILVVSNTSNRVERSPASPDGVTYYDIRLDRGKTYCVAIVCLREGHAPGSWAPWLQGAEGGRKWYRIEVPELGNSRFFRLPEVSSPDELVLTATQGPFRGFDAASPRFSEECEQP
ncbi:hypothetical protein ACFL6M_04125 [Candidatus Eisenbacteria bacterium]|uniref:Uncharacterized protein n=1 Tax=Eiseniibacteriota bacterium TaxID=2212470 RepID=A0ABV6YKB5_UNCEI